MQQQPHRTTCWSPAYAQHVRLPAAESPRPGPCLPHALCRAPPPRGHACTCRFEDKFPGAQPLGRAIPGEGAGDQDRALPWLLVQNLNPKSAQLDVENWCGVLQVRVRVCACLRVRVRTCVCLGVRGSACGPCGQALVRREHMLGLARCWALLGGTTLRSHAAACQCVRL